MIAIHLEEIEKECDFLLTSEQLEIIRYQMAQYALDAIMDSSVAKEAEEICMEELN